MVLALTRPVVTVIVLDPQFGQIELHGFAVYAHVSYVTAFFHHFLADIPSGGVAHGFHGAIHAAAAGDFQNLGYGIFLVRINGVGGAHFFGHG